MHGWPQNHREFLPVIDAHAERYTFIAPDLRGYADSESPRWLRTEDDRSGHVGATRHRIGERFHILSHDLGGPPSVALAYLAPTRALSLATIETPCFGLELSRVTPIHGSRIGISGCT